MLITSDVDERDRPFIEPDSRTPEGFFRLKQGTGLDHCIARGLAYAEYADLLWWETSHPDLDDARKFAEAIHKRYPGKLLAYNCSPSFNWKKKLDDATIAQFQRELGAMGYKFQFVTLAGFHQLNYGMFDLASGYRDRGMGAYSELQAEEFDAEADGLHRDPPPARGRHRLFRPGVARHHGRQVVHDRHERFHRDRAIPPDAEAPRGGVNPNLQLTEKDHAT